MNAFNVLGLQAFLATPKFIKNLTDVSLNLSQMKGVEKDEKLRILKEELKKINQHLPASVYIPFVNNSIRNYAVLHIAISECRVFQTKERSPCLIAVELYRPDELTLYRPETKANISNADMKMEERRHSQSTFEGETTIKFVEHS